MDKHAAVQRKPTQTLFVWSKLVENGTKQALQEKRAEDEGEERKGIEGMEGNQDQEKKTKQDQAEEDKYDKDLAVQNLRREILLKEQAEYELSRTRERGYWDDEITYRPVGSDENERVIPRGLNRNTMVFLQRWLTVWGDKLRKIMTINDLQKAFYDTFIPWIFMKYKNSKYAFDAWANIKKIEHRNNETTYKNLQQWVIWEALDGGRPWIRFPLWIAASHITWKRVLKAMTKESGAFENGIIALRPDGSFEWVVSLSPYESVEFCESKEKRLFNVMNDDYY